MIGEPEDISPSGRASSSSVIVIPTWSLAISEEYWHVCILTEIIPSRIYTINKTQGTFLKAPSIIHLIQANFKKGKIGMANIQRGQDRDSLVMMAR